MEKDTLVQFDRAVVGFKRHVEYCQYTQRRLLLLLFLLIFFNSFFFRLASSSSSAPCRGTPYCKSVRNVVECEANPNCYWDFHFSSNKKEHFVYELRWVSNPVNT
jgi:hypothetical protein